MKSLLEEQKRMKELMGFTYKDNSHDILSEENFNLSTLNEQLSRKKNYEIVLRDSIGGSEEQKKRGMDGQSSGWWMYRMDRIC